MKIVWIVCGNRGSVGKTLAALALISSLMESKRQVSVLDGDGRSPDVYSAALRKIPARSVDFRKLRPDLYNDMSVFDYESIVRDLLKISTDVVINTPDGSDDVLMEWFDATLRFTESTNCEFRLLFMMNQRENGLDILPAMASRFAMLFPIRNLHFGREEDFTAFDDKYRDLFRDTFTFPALRNQEVTALLSDTFLPLEFVQAKCGTLLARQRVKDWLAEASCTFSEILLIDAANSLAEPLYTQAGEFTPGALD